MAVEAKGGGAGGSREGRRGRGGGHGGHHRNWENGLPIKDGDPGNRHNRQHKSANSRKKASGRVKDV